MKADLTSCRTLDDIERALYDAVAGHPTAGGLHGARRHFLRVGISGKVRARAVFRQRVAFTETDPPFRRREAEAVIHRYYVAGHEAESLYGYDIYVI